MDTQRKAAKAMIHVLSTEVSVMNFNKAQSTVEGRIRLNYRSDAETGLFTTEIGTSVPLVKGAKQDEIEEALVAKALDYLCLGPHKVARNSVNIFSELRNREEERLRRLRPAPKAGRFAGLFGLRSIGLRLTSGNGAAGHA